MSGSAGVSTGTTRAVVLSRRPRGGDPVHDDFVVADIALATPEHGQLLVRNCVMSVDPSTRGRLGEGEMHYTTNFAVGGPLDGSAIGEVIESEDDRFPVGTFVRHRLGWREHAVVDADAATTVDPQRAPLTQWLGVLGQTGFTAYVGLMRAGRFSAGDDVFVSAAAGAVGSAAGQFARLLGAGRVVGSVGSAAKAELLTGSLGFDAAVDYRTSSIGAGLTELAPDGIDLYFDNVGGDHLLAALKALRTGGRVALCGMMSQGRSDQPSIDILMNAILKRISLQGFIVRDHEDLRPEFETRVIDWLDRGELVSMDTVQDGIDRAVPAFLSMLRGGNVGKMLVRLDSY